MNAYNKTIVACYIGYIVQAVVNNFAPLLFVTFQRGFGIPLDKIALLITANFGLQLVIDLIAAHFGDKIGYRKMVVGAHIFSAVGLILLGTLPFIMKNAMAALTISTVIYAVGGGLIEVVVSPIVEFCPCERKEAAMSLLHSFYCWGQVGVVLLSTLYFALFGAENYRFMAYIWALIPLFNAVMFLFVPIVQPENEHSEKGAVQTLFFAKIFWVFALLMVCAGASELLMSQWASAFVEEGLGVSKTIGDLMGPCLFAVFMGSARVFYAKKSESISLTAFMSVSAVLCIISYLLVAFVQNPFFALLGCSLCGISVGIMWPGTYSLAAKHCPGSGTAMFALLALAGDLGCTSGPTIGGFISSAFGDNLRAGLLFGVLFPLLLLLGIRCMKKAIQTE